MDANQVVAYFDYVNRVVEGLGVELEEHRPATVAPPLWARPGGCRVADPAALPWLSVQQMREVDRLVQKVGIALEQLMENPAIPSPCSTACCWAGRHGRPVVVFAGPHGNGGGAMVAARPLAVAGARVAVRLSAPPERLAPVPGRQHDILRRMGLEVQLGGPALGPADLVLDGLLG